MDTLWTYIVQTLKDAWANVILQKDYLASLWHNLINYLILMNSLWILFFWTMAWVAIYLWIRAIKTYIDKERSMYDDTRVWFAIPAVILWLVWTVSLCCSISGLIQVLFIPDIAIINYLK